MVYVYNGIVLNYEEKMKCFYLLKHECNQRLLSSHHTEGSESEKKGKIQNEFSHMWNTKNNIGNSWCPIDSVSQLTKWNQPKGQGFECEWILKYW